MVIKKAVCMHEEDAGILWKHMEYRDGTAEVRRSRKLVISFIATVVNYECTPLRPSPALGLSLNTECQLAALSQLHMVSGTYKATTLLGSISKT